MSIIYFPLILISFLGYGFFVNKNVIKLKNYNLGIVGLIGIFFLTLISYISTQFISHNLIFNSLIIFIGLMFFLNYFKKFKLNKNDNLIILLLFGFSILFILVGKNHDDFHYYHFPYILMLTDYPHPLGMGNWNHGFKTHSSLFLTSSLFHLPGAKYSLFHLLPAYFVFFSNFILLKIIFDKKNQKKFLFITFLSLSSFVFINVFFYRLGEHGTDRSAMILILIFLIYLFSLINNQINKIDKGIFHFIIILFVLIVSLKIVYIIYSLLLLPIIFYYFKKEKSFKFLLNSSFLLSSILFLFILLTNFLNTGCLLFPEKSSCFGNYSWSLSEKTVDYLSLHYETWAKAGVGSNYGISQDEKLSYISNFNWVVNWFDRYFFNKVSDLIFSLTFLALIFIILFKKDKISKSKKNNFKFFYSIIIFIFIFWFIKHPALRYGGYHLFFLTIFIPLSIYLAKHSKNLKNLEKKILVLILITSLILIGRNISRLIKENKIYAYNPLKKISYPLKDSSFRYQKKMREAIKNDDLIELYKNRFIITKN